MLQRRLPALPDADADRIADALGDLPLAVDQAAALLADTGLTADAYLDLLDRRTLDVLRPGTDRHPSMAASWAVAVDRLAATTRPRCNCSPWPPGSPRNRSR